MQRAGVVFALLVAGGTIAAEPAHAQSPLRKIGELQLEVIGGERAIPLLREVVQSGASSADREAAHRTLIAIEDALAAARVPGRLTVYGLRETTREPAAGAWVTLLTGGSTRAEQLDAQGWTSFAEVPKGTAQLIAGQPPDLGWWEGRIEPGRDNEVLLRIGGRQWLPLALGRGALVQADGGLRQGASGCDPFCVAAPGVNGHELAWQTVARMEKGAAGDEAILGPADMGGVEVTRRVLRASAGRVRIVDLLHNPGSRSQLLSYELRLGFEGRSLVGTSNGDAVLEDGDYYAVLGRARHRRDDLRLTFGSASAALPDKVQSQAGSILWHVSRWPDLSLAPGSTVGLVHLVAPAGEAIPGELFAGLTDDEKASLLNFHLEVPPQREAR